MKTIKWTVVTILVLLIAVNTLPALAAGDNVIVTIKNQADRDVTVTLSGQQRYTFTVRSGNTRVNMVAGDYYYFFYGCNQYNYGSFKAKTPKSTLVLDCNDPAAGVPDVVNLKISNRSEKRAYVRLNGPTYYYLTVEPGVNTFLVKEGTYSYSYMSCDQSMTGNIKVSGETTNFTIDKCQAVAEPITFRVRVVNKTEGSLILYLWGPEYHYFYIPKGESMMMDVSPNTYKYTAVATCDGIREVVAQGKIQIYHQITWPWYCR
jgi:hypothetical protein